MALDDAKQKIRDESKTLIIVEGNDDANFFDALLRHTQLSSDAIQLINIYGKGNYKDKFEVVLFDQNFSNITSYAVIRDADEDVNGSLDSIQRVLRDNRQPCPSHHNSFAYDENKELKVGVFLMPGKLQKGALEDLCLWSVQKNPIMPYLDKYMFDVKAIMKQNAPRNESKAKVQIFLASMPDSVPNLGIGARKHYWPFDDSEFSDIRAFIRQLIS